MGENINFNIMDSSSEGFGRSERVLVPIVLFKTALNNLKVKVRCTE